MRCNIEHRNPLGSIANFARHQYQDQADPSELQPHQPPMNQSYQPHKRPHTYQFSSCQLQTSQPRVGPNLDGAGILNLIKVYADLPNLYALVIEQASHHFEMFPTPESYLRFSKDMLALSIFN